MVAGRHVHVVYFDAVLAACDLLDDQAWDELTQAWAQLSRATGACRAAARAQPPQLAGGSPGTPRFGDLPSWRDRGHRVAHRLARVLGSPAPAVVLRDAWQGTRRPPGPVLAAMRDADERGQGMGVDHAYLALTVSSSARAGMTPPSGRRDASSTMTASA